MKDIFLINFEQVPIFDEALVSSVIITLSKQESIDSFNYVKYFKEKVLTLQNPHDINLRKSVMDQSFLKNDNWLFNDSNSDNIVDKMQLKGSMIADIPEIQIKRGLTTGYDDAFLINKTTYDQLTSLDSVNHNIVEKVLKGQNIKKYEIKFNDLWIINSHNGMKGGNLAINVEKDYPLIFAHLQSVNIKSDFKVENRSDKGRHWTNLRSCAFLDDFLKPKIIWGLISGNCDFAYDDKGYFLTSASFFLISDKLNIKFLLALFNSKLYRYYFTQVGEYTAGGAFVLKKTTIEKFIVPKVDTIQRNKLVDLVENILLAKQSKEDTTAFESEIDKIVYNLYELTDEEMKVVEFK